MSASNEPFTLSQIWPVIASLPAYFSVLLAPKEWSILCNPPRVPYFPAVIQGVE